ncbi:MAG: 3-oxoacid CoA-transferase subunit A [Chloroflexota bacterium]
MPVNKVVQSFDKAIADIGDGASIMVSGAQGPLGVPRNLLLALRRKGVHNLTLITATGYRSVSAARFYGFPHAEDWIDHGILIDNHQVSKVICAMAYVPGRDSILQKQYEAGEVELEHLGHGPFIIRMWAGAAGLGGVYQPVGIGTILEQDKEKRVIDGREYLLEMPLTADFALVGADKADSYGNLVYKGTGRQYGPIMAKAARVTIAEVDEVVEPGGLAPESIVTPGIYVQKVVRAPPEVCK